MGLWLKGLSVFNDSKNIKVKEMSCVLACFSYLVCMQPVRQNEILFIYFLNLLVHLEAKIAKMGKSHHLMLPSQITVEQLVSQAKDISYIFNVLGAS